MNAERLQQLVDELDAAVPRDDAKVQIRRYGGGDDECELIANRAGFLRLGVELLHAADARAGAGNQRETVPADLDYLWLHDEGSVVIDTLIRRDPTAAPDVRWHWQDSAALLFGAAWVTLTVVGCYTAAVWVGGWLL
jgi:hypothetical protein